MVRTFCIVALLLFASAAVADEHDAGLFAGVTTHWAREALAVDEFEDTPEQVPARNASTVDAGSTFSWSRAALTLELGAEGGEAIEWRVAAQAGLATLRLSQEIEGGPRTTVSTASNDGVTGGVSLGGRCHLSSSGWWLDGDYRLELGYAALDNAQLFGGTPIEGSARWLRHDLALRAGLDLSERFGLYTGGRLLWTQLSTEWELAFDLPAVTRDTDARFTTRHPARWLLGFEWRPPGDAAAFTLELSAGRLPTDAAALLCVGLRF